ADMTALENMELHAALYHVPRKVASERIESLMKLFELWERRKDLVKLFSGGMKRRLEIARGLLHTPKILFLDEPTLGLGPQTRNQLWGHVKHLNDSVTVDVDHSLRKSLRCFLRHVMTDALKNSMRVLAREFLRVRRAIRGGSIEIARNGDRRYRNYRCLGE